MYPLLVTAAIIVHDGKVLLTRRRPDAPYPLLWEFPGGKVELDEDPQECVIRELREELDIVVSVDKIYDVVYYRYPERTVLIMAYACRWIEGDIKELDVAGHSWVEPAKLMDFPLLPADVALAERIGREFGHAHTALIQGAR